MSKINDNTYVNKIKKEIMEGTFATKEDLMNFLIKNRQNILNDPFFNQELNNSFIKLNWISNICILPYIFNLSIVLRNLFLAFEEIYV